jgi:hypothetical protein
MIVTHMLKAAIHFYFLKVHQVAFAAEMNKLFLLCFIFRALPAKLRHDASILFAF